MPAHKNTIQTWNKKVFHIWKQSSKQCRHTNERKFEVIELYKENNRIIINGGENKMEKEKTFNYFLFLCSSPPMQVCKTKQHQYQEGNAAGSSLQFTELCNLSCKNCWQKLPQIHFTVVQEVMGKSNPALSTPSGWIWMQAVNLASSHGCDVHTLVVV